MKVLYRPYKKRVVFTGGKNYTILGRRLNWILILTIWTMMRKFKNCLLPFIIRILEELSREEQRRFKKPRAGADYSSHAKSPLCIKKNGIVYQ